MGTLSPTHWLIFFLPTLLSVIPIWRILGRVGVAPAWSLLYFIPFGGLIGLWIFAWARWPNLPEPQAATTVAS